VTLRDILVARSLSRMSFQGLNEVKGAEAGGFISYGSRQ